METISAPQFSRCPGCCSCSAAVCTSQSHQGLFEKLKSALITVFFKLFKGFPLFLDSNSDSAVASEPLYNLRIQPLPTSFFIFPLSHCALATLAACLSDTPGPFFPLCCFFCLKYCFPGSLQLNLILSKVWLRHHLLRQAFLDYPI